MLAQRIAIATLVAATLGLAAAVTAAPAAAAKRCPATFRVLHNDHIGAMYLPAGAYSVRVNRISCARASKLFAEFLQDYDGHLRRPWQANPKRQSFRYGNSRTGFAVSRGRRGKPSPRPPKPDDQARCPTFSVLHNDRIGSVRFPKGIYQTASLSGGVDCRRAAQLFAAFLDDVDGNLPGGWKVGPLPGKAAGGSFTNARQNAGFEQRYSGSRTSGGGVSPTDSVACGGFRLRHDDHIGSIFLPRGIYDIYTLAADRLSCLQAQRRLKRFLGADALPRPWVIEGATGTFTRGPGSNVGFRIKPRTRRPIR